MVSYCDDIWNLYYKAEYEGLNGFLYISITGYVLLLQLIFKSNIKSIVNYNDTYCDKLLHLKTNLTNK